MVRQEREGINMIPMRPEDWPAAFAERLNAGDLDGVMALYEPEARVVAPSGETLVGREAIRLVVRGLIEANTQMRSRVIQVVTIGDIAQQYTNAEVTSVDGAGKTITTHSKGIEVLRRQSEGSWKLIVGDPNGRA
jgi:uncharacterized protein (TIGR02246 family)